MATSRSNALKTNAVDETKIENQELSSIDCTDAEANATVAPAVLTDVKVEEPKVHSAEVLTVLNSTSTKSGKIRALLALSLKRGEVAKLLGIRYQHVRNVEITPIKKA
jgi:hypothetical protein